MRKTRKSHPPYPPLLQIKFDEMDVYACLYCLSEMPKGAIECTECGQKIDWSENDEN